MGSLLPLERMLREGVVDGQVTLVPVLMASACPSSMTGGLHPSSNARWAPCHRVKT